MPKKVTPKTRLRDIQRLLEKNTKLPSEVRAKFEAEAKTIGQQLQQVALLSSTSRKIHFETALTRLRRKRKRSKPQYQKSGFFACSGISHRFVL
jgi:hypothetical protein